MSLVLCEGRSDQADNATVNSEAEVARRRGIPVTVEPTYGNYHPLIRDEEGLVKAVGSSQVSSYLQRLKS